MRVGTSPCSIPQPPVTTALGDTIPWRVRITKKSKRKSLKHCWLVWTGGKSVLWRAQQFWSFPWAHWRAGLLCPSGGSPFTELTPGSAHCGEYGSLVSSAYPQQPRCLYYDRNLWKLEITARKAWAKSFKSERNDPKLLGTLTKRKQNASLARHSPDVSALIGRQSRTERWHARPLSSCCRVVIN